MESSPQADPSARPRRIRGSRFPSVARGTATVAGAVRSRLVAPRNVDRRVLPAFSIRLCGRTAARPVRLFLAPDRTTEKLADCSSSHGRPWSTHRLSSGLDELVPQCLRRGWYANL